MWVTLLVLIFSAAIYWLDGKPLWKKGRRKEWASFSLLLAAAAALCIYESESLNLPSPIPFLTRILSPVSTAIEQWAMAGSG